MNSARLVMSFVIKLLVLGVCGFGLCLLGHASASVPAVAEPVDSNAERKAAFSGRGRILNADGQPVAAASVRVSGAGGRLLERTITRPNGVFQLAQHQEPFRVEVEHPLDGRTQSAWLEAQNLVGANADPLTLVLEPPIEWSGSVVDAEGAPIADAQLHVAAAHCTEHCEATWASADSHGRFALRITSPGAYQVLTWARGFAPRRLVFELTSNSAAERITLSAHGSVRGVVLTPDGQPIAQAIVRVCEEERLVELTSASDGSFLLSSNSVGCDAVAHHPRFAHSTPVRIRAGQRMTLRLAVGGSIEGIATDPSGYPTKDLSVELTDYTPADDEAYFPIDRFGSSTAIGHTFRFTSLSPGRYAAKVTRRPSNEDENSTESEFTDIQVLAGSVTRGIQVIVPTT